MPAPLLLAAAKYFGVPRLMGYAADQAMNQRYQDLSAQGVDPGSDTAMNLLSMVPRQSSVETAFDFLRNQYREANKPQVVDPMQQMMTGGYDWRPEGESVTSATSYFDPVTAGQPNTGAVIYRDRGDFGGEFVTPMEDYLARGGQEGAFGTAGQSYYGLPEGPTREELAGLGAANGGLMVLMRNRYA